MRPRLPLRLAVAHPAPCRCCAPPSGSSNRRRTGPLVYVVADDTRARTLFDIVRALSPDATSVHLPASDALPGDDAPSSPANAGQRVAALRQVRKWHEDGETAPLICLTSAEATVQSYAPPAAFTASPPSLVSGQSLDLAHFEEECVARGYVIDDRIDEPGEIAIRGSVVDIFPVDATHPVRIEIEEARITAIRTYDPIDQRTLEDVDAVEIGRAREPDTGGGGALLDHFEDCTLIEEAAVAARRKSYLALAKDAARFGRAARGTISDADWAAAARATGQNLFGLAERKQVAPTSPRFQRGLLGRGPRHRHHGSRWVCGTL